MYYSILSENSSKQNPHNSISLDSSSILILISVVFSYEWWDSKESCSDISVLHEFSVTRVSEDGHC